MQTRSVRLGAEQVERYWEQGFLVLESVIESAAIERLKAAALCIVDNFDIKTQRSVFTTSDRDSGRDRYFFESAEGVHCFLEEHALDEKGALLESPRLAVNKIGHAMHDLDPAFGSFCRMALFRQVLRDIGYRAPLLWQTMYIFKQPRIGGEVRWHQDASYLVSQPPTVTGIWVAMEDAHRGNGCLWVQPGGHRTPLREVYQREPGSPTGSLKTLDETPWPNRDEALAVEVPTGSVVLFHDHMPHYSSQNRSDHSRHAFTLHVAEKSSAWSEKNWLQRPSLGDFEL